MNKSLQSTKQLEIDHGRTLVVDTQSLTITDTDGVLELAIELTADGPVVRVRAAQLRVETDGDIALDCQRFAVEARDGIRLVTEGDLSTSVAGDVSCCAG